MRNASLVTEAAIELFADHGTDVTLAQVAGRAGVGKATVYRACGTYPPALGGQHSQPELGGQRG